MVVLTPYKPEPGNECRISQEYYDRKAQMCCAKCPPGQYVKHFCNKTSDTVCEDCEASMYTQVWNQFRTCLSCRSSCSADQVETRACTKQQNRVCACKADSYCALETSGSCRLCLKLSKCGPGFGVACPTLRPRQQETTQDTGLGSTINHQALAGPSGFEAIQKFTTDTLSGLIVGLTALGLLMLGLVNCFILVRRKKKPSCLQRETKVPHLPDEKSKDAVGLEQQHLLITAPSSSSSSLESSASAGDRRAPPGGHPQARATAAAAAQGSQEGCAGSRSSDSSHGSHGTHVNVTCIVNVCSSPDHSSQCSSQASATVGDPDATPSGSPKDEQVPFSQEECPSPSRWETTETLQSHEKPLPLGETDMGMKPSQHGWYDQIAVKVA
ncbi:Tumor necrosis factor receptor superfamily member 1B [Apodemus speciosus]|uniref:Tumor necrosis factor receptor superfamily member 1B n=1 Tax=Apodemus speciosus TaxID=105296 RepID=A0ABQ0EQT9_APOSI